jgi:ElaA protein
MTETADAAASPSVTVQWRDFGALSVYELHDILKLRSDVFVLEQGIVGDEIDGRDPETVHGLLRDEGGEIVATARMFAPGPDGAARIGRVVTRGDRRGQGLGKAIMRSALAEVRRRWGAVPVLLGAQSHLQRFYADFGFEPVSGLYDDHGIPHVEMRLPPEA